MDIINYPNYNVNKKRCKESDFMSNQVKVAIVGLGSRGKDTYAKTAHLLSDKMKIVAIADIVPEKVQEVSEEYQIPPEMCFSSAEEMLRHPKLADVMFICTQDRQHYEHAIPALTKGYHLLLEKPISPELRQCKEIARTAHQYHRKIVVCHVLRYTPFYQTLKKILTTGEIGEIVSIQAIENVGYWHQAHSFVRGNWRNSDSSSPMVLQKSCHDMDILLWLAGKKCNYVSSFGGLRLFKRENAPEGSTMRCTDDCTVKDSCPFNAERIYLTDGVQKGKTDWPINVLTLHPTVETVSEALQTGPYGRCVYHCDNNVVDHQVVNLELEDDTTISFTMCAFTSDNSRNLKIMGTKGDITADMSTMLIEVCPFGKPKQVIDVKTLADDFSGHGGGEHRMIKELLDLIQDTTEISKDISLIDQSTESHYVALAAEYSRIHHGVSVRLEQFIETYQ